MQRQTLVFGIALSPSACTKMLYMSRMYYEKHGETAKLGSEVTDLEFM
jgi:hypothetical protein